MFEIKTQRRFFCTEVEDLRQYKLIYNRRRRYVPCQVLFVTLWYLSLMAMECIISTDLNFTLFASSLV